MISIKVHFIRHGDHKEEWFFDTVPREGERVDFHAPGKIGGTVVAVIHHTYPIDDGRVAHVEIQVS